jgi:hypothetical protein
MLTLDSAISFNFFQIAGSETALEQRATIQMNGIHRKALPFEKHLCIVSPFTSRICAQARVPSETGLKDF